ncbi:MAG: CDP-alcohol phosphatidyltransferase family protein, partial [Planctomycetota bacterium]
MTDDITGKKRSRFLFVFVLTVLRGPLSISFAALFLIAGPGWTRVVLGLCLLAAMELTDLLDGFVARRFDVVTEWGAALDPYMDSFSRLIVYWTFACVGLILPLVPLVMALRDVTAAYCRIFLARAGHTVAANWSGKTKAVVQAVATIVIVAEPIYAPLLGSWVPSA